MQKIRPYEDRDEEAVLNIYASSKMDEFINEKEIIEFLPLIEDKYRYIYLIESKIFVYDDNRVIGYCAHLKNEIRALFVLPRYRGMGLGKCMFEFMLSDIKEKPFLYVAKSNIHAKRFYAEYGFEVVDEFETNYNGKSVYANKMIKFQ